MGKKLGNTGKVGKVATGKKSPPKGTVTVPGLAKVTMGSAMGLLNKHFKGVK